MMRIVCIGGGPAGLYFAILAKLSNGNHHVTVVERNPAGVTYGWGVVFWDDLLDDLYRNDPVSAREISESAARWDQQKVHIRQQTAYIAGYGFSMGRHRLLEILTQRALSLGVDVRFQEEVEDLSEFAHADLIVACDGANSKVRQLHGNPFQTNVEVGRNKYIWLGTDKVFDSFTFAFEETPAGWIWFHAYHFDGKTSTCIVECPPETWAALGFDKLGPDETLRHLEDIFKSHLAGHSLFLQTRGLRQVPWLNFKCISNKNWYHDKVVLMGDSAHTAHFSIGSGTKLAIQDAIGLARKLREHEDLQAALEAYGEERRTALRTILREARGSTEWFENVPRYVARDAIRFAYSMLNRRGSSPPWRYLLYLATQQGARREVLGLFHSVRRGVRSRRRERRVVSPWSGEVTVK
jgi:anthraniloyl-CoA monooxygenase